MFDKDKVVKEYKENFSKFEEFTNEVKTRIEKLFKNSDYSIKARTKSIDSFSEKITRDGKNYTDPLIQITDLSGVRIVVPSIDEISKVENKIRENFKIDEVNSSTKKKNNDEFGYKSRHLIISFDETITASPMFSKYKGLKCEIQIRTFLEHAWASIEHRINYKSSKKLPDETVRRLNSISALLELADREFQSILSEYDSLVNELKNDENIEENKKIPLNSDTVKIYLESREISEFYKKLSNKEIYKLNIDLKKEIFLSMQFFKLLKVADINTLSQLKDAIFDSSFENNIEKIIKIWEVGVTDKNLKFVLDRVSFARWQIYFHSSNENKKKILKNSLLTENMKNLIHQSEQ